MKIVEIIPLALRKAERRGTSKVDRYWKED